MIVLERLFLTIAPCDAAEPWQLGSQDAATPIIPSQLFSNGVDAMEIPYMELIFTYIPKPKPTPKKLLDRINLFYLSLEVGREKVNMIFALVFPTKLGTSLLSHLEGSVPHPDFNDGNNLRTPMLH
ncbi:cytochrome c oxidase subunit 2 [Datura stramonium]|uniref:Cytochrome c oxidase subunit 2 n=1 Tax=Datura stramonium TaxID=4076 RepID=A0ABS8WMB2_DATST|nr:cytochrome c oxidase subunit 2 [Datura stramonium]